MTIKYVAYDTAKQLLTSRDRITSTHSIYIKAPYNRCNASRCRRIYLDFVELCVKTVGYENSPHAVKCP